MWGGSLTGKQKNLDHLLVQQVITLMVFCISDKCVCTYIFRRASKGLPAVCGFAYGSVMQAMGYSQLCSHPGLNSQPVFVCPL